MNDEQKETRRAAVLSLLLTVLPWVAFLADGLFELRLQRYGLRPLDGWGLTGIWTMPFLHGDVDHLMSNTPSLFLLIFGLFLFYRHTAWRILFCLYFMSGLLTWLMGRSGPVHIGASGLAYALAAFHFGSGLIKKVPQQMAFALLVAFLYGGYVWAFFPMLYQGTNISWEGHLSGLMAGILFAFYFRRDGPGLPPDPFSEEDEEEDEEDENNRMASELP
ncbi:MAG: rhomboid family intramembrane serine protease [Tannerella sp.]|nr:rhomboid family intramembrane serine protease [Tannerella sp.]